MQRMMWIVVTWKARIYAEDPERDFMPGAGRLTHLRPPDPSASTHMRVETGVREGPTFTLPSLHFDLACLPTGRLV